ncbi:AAA family ATPase [Nocardioides agariphilus]|uniref:AAA family ATPase n=1 Tax=Nocardioides agariphilus TaxID=433664 RepID=A0A930VK63_9ACTN|nr:AAA family ATPase [Nocardioides agariphilus]
MPAALTLLDGVAWRGRAVPGERVAALLAALASRPEGLTDTRLIELIWAGQPDGEPANPTKALQVLVSRARAALGADGVERYDGGYRLGVAVEDVDALLLRKLTREAGAALDAGDPARAADLAGRAAGVELADTGSDAGPLAELRHDAAGDRRRAGRVLGLALAAGGRDQEALPHLEAAHGEAVHDVAVTAALLRSVAATAGPAAALERYEGYRADLADRLGVDPDPSLQRLHRELLVADSPVRDGVHFEVDDLLGRQEDLAELRAAVRRSRLVSIVGPGGLGKTRVAHVLAREATQPRVYFVELVGVTSGDDVVAEVGAALGVRGSVTGRRTLTPAQLADVRSQIATELDTAPTLLVLDNCEHVLESVASLVALLLVTTRDLHVLTTSRAPLGLAAEQVVSLRQLAPDDASALFVQRARAARADADLPADAVADIVARLDGLPLAIELAAARVRTMTVEEVRRRIGDLFSLLRSRDRSAPERHRTLTAVIEWSWDLLDPGDQEGMARLSVFHDGFTRDTALAVLGRGGADLVETLAEQSLLTVAELDGTTRFRMLETIREFGAERLSEAGLRPDAHRCQDAWAVDLVRVQHTVMFTPDEIAAINAIGAEENNLADVLRRALRDGDREVVAQVLACLGAFWTITGNHPRIFTIADAAEALLADWDPPEQLRTTAQLIASWLIVHLSWMPHRSVDTLRAALARWGEPTHPWARIAHAMFVDDDPGVPTDQRVAALAEGSDPVTAQMALLWAALIAENSGDIAVAATYAREGLTRQPLTPYLEASLHGQLAQLAMNLGDYRTAAEHAEVAWPILDRLHADDDARAIRAATIIWPLLEGDFETAERVIAETDTLGEPTMGSQMVLLSARAELALARGEITDGLRLFDEALASVRPIEGLDLGGLNPWVLIAASASLVARVRHGTTAADETRARELVDVLAAQETGARTDNELPDQDFPLNGALLAALGAWAVRFGGSERHADGARLLAVADRWSYNRSFPTMAWEALQALAEQAVPNLLEEVTAEYADRPAADLLAEARTLVSRVTTGVTSSG